MYCARCGKQIEDDSTFCPFCGQETDAPVTEAEGGAGGRKSLVQTLALPGLFGNKKVWGTVLALLAVAAVGFGAVKLFGGHKMKSVPEELFAMSWEEFSELSLEDMRDMLDEADIFYEEDYDNPGFETVTVEPFLEGDAIFLHDSSRPALGFAVGFRSTDDFKDFKDSLEDYLGKRVIKNAAVMSDKDSGYDEVVYPVEVSANGLEHYLDAYVENADAYDLEQKEYGVYKFVTVRYTRESLDYYAEEAAYQLDEDYVQRSCLIDVNYYLMEKNQFTILQARYGHDAISGKEMDLEKFQDSVDERLVRGYLKERVRENPDSREELEKEFYTKLYMLEKHGFDMASGTFLKTKEEERLWYVRSFNWDVEKRSLVDLSNYRNSSDIYCAVEFGYNSRDAKYFESDLDKALYLAEQNYKLGTGKGFESDAEKRLWFMQSYGYDTSSGKVIEKEVVDALIAYQNFVPKLPYIEEEPYVRYTLIYLNDDEVPECLVWSNSYNPDPTVHGAVYILSYNNGAVQMFDPDSAYQFQVSFSYTPRKGKFCAGTVLGLRSAEDWVVAELDSDFHKIGTAWQDNDWEDYYYELNDSEVQEGEIEAYIDSFGFEIKIDSKEAETSILSAYDALRTTTYQILAYEFTEFSMSDGVLTFSSDGAARYGEENPKAFSHSFPVAEDCSWGYYNAGETYPYQESDYEDMKAQIESDMDLYATDFEMFGEIGWDSPPGYYITVVDDEVVDVKVVYS